MAHGQQVIEHTGVLTTGDQPVDETPDFSNAEPQPGKKENVHYHTNKAF